MPRQFEPQPHRRRPDPDRFRSDPLGRHPDMVESIDRVALWNLVATVDAFLSSGFTPAELMRWVHPGLVANTQGTGMGGMTSMRELYINTLLGEAKANDILQEALPNIVAAHVVQSYIGSYGAMIHPVAACATAAVSVEEGVDKIRLGRHCSPWPAASTTSASKGSSGSVTCRPPPNRPRWPHAASTNVATPAPTTGAAAVLRRIAGRWNDSARPRRRGCQMGLPVLGVVAWAQSFGDGVHLHPGTRTRRARRGPRRLTSPWPVRWPHSG